MNSKIKWQTMKLQPELLCFCLLCLTGKTLRDSNGPAAIKVLVTEGSDVMLPCSLSTKENIEQNLFDWSKDDVMTRVYIYDKGLHHNNGRSGQSEQFKGRVFHFQDELKHGNASIIIRNTKMADSGDYTCDFPFLQKREISHVMLVVVSSPKPSVTILDDTDDGMLLQCVVRGASPKPEVEWQDSDGNKLPAEEPQVRERGGSYDIILRTTVNKTDRYRCVVTQEEINHQTHAETYVPICGVSRIYFIVVWLLLALATVACSVAVAIRCLYVRPINRSDKEIWLWKSGHLMKNNVGLRAGGGTRTQTKPEDLQSRSGSGVLRLRLQRGRGVAATEYRCTKLTGSSNP